MGEYKLSYEDKENGCIYCWDEKNKRWMQVSPIAELPAEIRPRVLAAKV